MGMYTELYLACDLKKDTEQRILDWLNAHMTEDTKNYWKAIEKTIPEELIDTRLDSLTGGSYYFYAQQYRSFEYDTVSKSYHLTVILNIKNYKDEIATLLDLLMPHIDASPGEHIGHVRYEEDRLPQFLVKK